MEGLDSIHEASRDEWRNKVKAYINGEILQRVVYIPGEPVEESDYLGEGKND